MTVQDLMKILVNSPYDFPVSVIDQDGRIPDRTPVVSVYIDNTVPCLTLVCVQKPKKE